MSARFTDLADDGTEPFAARCPLRALSVLGVAGAEVRLTLRDRRVVYARVVRAATPARLRVRLLPWGCSMSIAVDLDDVAQATLVLSAPWAMQRWP